jgi:N-acetylglucosaminyldiphosphoundecaprenol N-acetyl-beta-D-mannosaminyltransferase
VMDTGACPIIQDDLCREVYAVLGIPIDATDMPKALNVIRAAADKHVPFVISTPNLNFLVNSLSDSEFRESLLQSDLCPADGMPIVFIARLLGTPIRERIAGSDIFETLKSSSTGERPLKVFFFGGTESVAAEACNRLNSKGGGLECVGWLCPGFVDLEELTQDHFVAKINSSNADFLVAALGARKGQLWLRRNHFRLQIPIRSHLGATINFQAGTVKRAPRVVRKIGFEWLWRIKEEPTLFKRYWRDGLVLTRLVWTRVLPLATRMAWLRVNAQRHDFVIVLAHGKEDITVRLSGYATAKGAPEAIGRFREAVASRKQVVVDLSRTKALDARFLGLLLMLRKQLKGNGSALKLVGASTKLRRQFRLNELEFLL